MGDWGGIRSDLERHGVTPRLILVTDLAGNASGGLSKGITAPTSVELSLVGDLDKMFGIKGGSVFLSASQRWGRSLSQEYIGNVFGTQQIYGFQTWRLIDFSYQQALFNDRVELRLGRFAATDDFMVSAYSCGLVSNAFCGNPFGILLDAPGMTAYTGTWAALIKVKPTPRTYLTGAVYNGDLGIRADEHHGLDFSIRGPAFAMVEFGYQVNGLPGDSQLLGNYKLGAWYDAGRLTDFKTGAEVSGSWGAYGLFDQVLVPFGSSGSNRGLGAIGSVTIAPDSGRQQLPAFFTVGLSARGLFDARPRDALSVGFATGRFSDELRRAQQVGRLPGPLDGQGHEDVAEFTYRLDIQEGAVFVQPDLQYVLHPGGTDEVKNALVWGVQVGINF
ncbi:carbohydrate porin [Lysobacter sp. KIS68-7]|uniref:carbohydrate porin n=1 Tax=Lysobacter sp. KIS68-7 TaxID=2904252 RepID=UPI001E3312F6|nr:carbohydrate porin [Lysobacter sp. KIS68-7]UHQ19399.1 carbohydrate porin [Lysobacter sp. KIS68-7]